MQLIDKALLDGRLDFDHFAAAAAYEPQAVHHVANLRLTHEHHGVVSQPGVRAKQNKKIGEAAHGDAQIGADPLFPSLADVHAVAADDAHVVQRFGGAETGSVTEHVNRAFD